MLEILYEDTNVLVVWKPPGLEAQSDGISTVYPQEIRYPMWELSTDLTNL